MDRIERRIVNGHDPIMEVAAPAKVNLTLEVLNRRDDGFHELRTLMLRLRLHDTLRFADADGDELRLQVRCAGVLSGDSTVHRQLDDPDNLILRAAQALRAYVGRRPGATIELVKRIPLQAGLGGGSSDAATTLLALNRLWSLQLSISELQKIAASLGSDLHFFLNRGTAAICEGRGERVRNVKCRSGLPVVLAKPRSGLSTAAVFREMRSSEMYDDGQSSRLADALSSGRWSRLNDFATNALQAAALRKSSHVGSTLERLEAASTMRPLMSGSGTTCFVICRSFRQARIVARRMQQQFEGTVLPTLCW